MKPINITLSIDRLVCSVYERHRTPFDPNRLRDMSNYKLVKSYNQNDQNSNKYQIMSEFVNIETGLTLKICSVPRVLHIPPYLLTFNSSWNDKLMVQHVEEVEKYFSTLNMTFRCAEIHLAIDIHSDEENVLRFIWSTLKTGRKRPPLICKDTTLYFGATSCPSGIIVYDKAKQLRQEKCIELDHQCVRIELRFKSHRIDFLPRGVQELADLDWSLIYDRYVSFCIPNKYLIETVNEEFEKSFAEELLSAPSWVLCKVIKQELDMPTYNYNRDFLEVANELAEPVIRALAEYRWRDQK